MKKPSVFWVVLGVALVILLAFTGMAPVQKDEPSVLTEDTPGRSQKPALPSGHPPHSMPIEPGAY